MGRAEALLQQSQKSGIRGRPYENVEQALAALGLIIDTGSIEKIREKLETLEKAVSEQSRLTPANFEDLFGGFESLFGKQGFTKQKSSGVEQKSRKVEQPPSNKLETRDTRASQGGKIFGGGDFTLDPNLCFVLMPFEEKLRAVYEDHMRRVVESKGLSCTRADDIMSTGLITRDIWEKINRARFLIADLTGKNPNVFYELGIAHALGKEVILITQNIEYVPFDLKALRCIIYSFTPRGMTEMEGKLLRTIEEIMRSA
jgi:hypothetical protein